MPKLKPGTIIPTDAEAEAIRTAAATDPDSPIWTDADFARARPASEVLAPAVYAAAVAKRPPGRPAAPRPSRPRYPWRSG